MCIETQNNRKNNKTGGSKLPAFEPYYKATEIKTVWSWHKNKTCRPVEQIDSLEINLCIYGYLIFDMGAKNTQ